MGFSLIFIGYFAVYFMSLHTFGYIFHFAGSLVVLLGAIKLTEYNKSARWLSLSCVLMMIVSAAKGGAVLLRASPALTDTLEHIFIYTALLFNVALLYAIRSVARDTEVLQISRNAIRNFCFLCFYYFLHTAGLVMSAVNPESDFFAKHLNILMLLSNLFFVVLNLVLIGSCYARICDENEKDMPEKTSKFDLFRFFDKNNRKR